jgi:peptidoglycan hydrolase-like protein with peptidoglycan-binding domain
MDTLRKGDQGSQVRQLQKLLVQRGCAADVNGTFDTKTWQATRAFQTQNLDQHGQPLVVDGVAGPLTWWSLRNPKPFIRTPTAVDYAALPTRGGSKPGRAALAAAVSELKANAREIGDIVVWWRINLTGWFGHTGLVHSVQEGMLYTIEGNHSPRVQGFPYVLSRMDKLLGFGHVP